MRTVDLQPDQWQELGTGSMTLKKVFSDLPIHNGQSLIIKTEYPGGQPESLGDTTAVKNIEALHCIPLAQFFGPQCYQNNVIDCNLTFFCMKISAKYVGKGTARIFFE